MTWCPAQLSYYERPQEKTMGWARGGKGLVNRSDRWPCHDLKQSLDPFRVIASYAQQTASSGSRTVFSGCSVTHPPWVSVGTQWNSSTMKSCYKWTWTLENSPRNHRMCFMSCGDPWICALVTESVVCVCVCVGCGVHVCVCVCVCVCTFILCVFWDIKGRLGWERN